MKKQELVRAVAQETGQSDTQASNAINAVFSSIEKALAEGDDVTISGFGSFRVVHRAEREGRNPQTGQAMTIGARKSPAFRAGTQLKRAIGGE